MKSQLVAFVRGTEGQDLNPVRAVGGDDRPRRHRGHDGRASRTERDVQHDRRLARRGVLDLAALDSTGRHILARGVIAPWCRYISGHGSELMVLNPSQIAVVVLGAAASWCDLRTRHIPNLLTFGGAALGISWSLYAGGASGLLTGIGGWLTGVAVFAPFFSSAAWGPVTSASGRDWILAWPARSPVGRSIRGPCWWCDGAGLGGQHRLSRSGGSKRLAAADALARRQPAPASRFHARNGPRSPASLRAPNYRGRAGRDLAALNGHFIWTATHAPSSSSSSRSSPQRAP